MKQILSRRRVASLVVARQTLASLVREVSQSDGGAPDTCFHFGINWRALAPKRDGRLHATCSCGAHVTRSAFTN